MVRTAYLVSGAKPFLILGGQDATGDQAGTYLYLLVLCPELLTSLFMSQFNISIAAIIVLAYALIEKEKDVWAAFVIMLGTFTKLYGITGLAFFFFSRHKMKFSLSCVGWAVVMVVAPMILSGPDYIMSQYTGWFEDLSGKIRRTYSRSCRTFPSWEWFVRYRDRSVTRTFI